MKTLIVSGVRRTEQGTRSPIELFWTAKNMTHLRDSIFGPNLKFRTCQSSDCVWYPKTQSSRQFFNSFPNIFFSFFLPNQIGNKLISIGWFGKNTSLEVAWFGTGWGIIPDKFPTEFGMVQSWGWIRSPRQSWYGLNWFLTGFSHERISSFIVDVLRSSDVLSPN